MRMKKLLLFLYTTAISFNLYAQSQTQTLHQLNTLLINTVMEDLFSPPVGSRIYVYPNIAFYECIINNQKDYQPLSGKINNLNPLPKPTTNIDNYIAACISFSYTAQAFVATEHKFEDWRNNFITTEKQKTDSMLWQNSFNYGKQIADSIIAYSKRDNYLKSRGLMRYVVTNKPSDWQPTPLDYAQGLEPHWNTIRPLTLNSPSQFSPKQKLVYSKSKKSAFYKTMMETYTIGKNLDSVKKSIALYWDDNPNVSKNSGHLNYFIHKISPGGHWVMIAKQACEKKQVSVTEAAQVYALTTIAIFDAFISCWDEKYKTNLIRPITVINREVDKYWQPYIQTPPFPEFTSGHSVTSNAAATVLTTVLGENFSFTDNTEIPFGQGTRTFSSFYQAAAESSISRVYGGIHYKVTATISTEQGKAVGKNVLHKLYTKH
jgi:hypothetical protein